MANVLGINPNRPTPVTESSFLGTCTEAFMGLIKKIQEVFMAIFQTIFFWFFPNPEPIDPTRVTNSGNGVDLNNDASLQNHAVNADEQAEQEIEQQRLHDELEMQVVADFVQLPLEEDEIDLVNVDPDPSVDQVNAAENDERVQRVLQELANISASRGVPLEDNKMVLPQAEIDLDEILRREVVAGKALKDPKMALALVLNGAKKNMKDVTKGELDAMVDQAEEFFRPNENFDKCLTRAGFKRAHYEMEQQHERYEHRRRSTLRFTGTGELQSSYAERIQDAVIGLRMKAQDSNDQQVSAIIRVQDRVYGLYVQMAGRSIAYSILNPSELVDLKEFSSAKDLAAYFTSRVEKETLENNLTYSVVPIEPIKKAVAADNDEKEEKTVELITSLKPNEAPAGFCSACHVFRDFVDQSPPRSVDAQEIHDYLFEGLTTFNEMEGSIQIDKLDNQIESLGQSRSRRKWADYMDSEFKKKRELQCIVLSNKNFSVSYTLIILPEGDNAAQYCLWSPNAIPATFTIHNNLADLKAQLGARQTRYFAYKVKPAVHALLD